MRSYDLVKRVLVAGMISAGTLFVILGIYFGESRAVVLGIFSIVWVIITLRTDAISASVLMLIASLPFNITYTIPQLLENAYVNGIFVNYLAPTLSITDLFAILTANTFLFLQRVKIGKHQKLLLLVLGGYLIFHTILFREVIVSIQSFRWIVYLTSSMAIVSWLRNDPVSHKAVVGSSILKIYSVIKLLLVLSIIQLIIGLFQLIHGTSVGLGVIGESMVAAGSANSSSIAINGDLYLRAYGTFPHPNLYAGYAIFTIILSIGFLQLIPRKKQLLTLKQHILPIFLTLSSSIAILISFSHSAYLVLLIFSLVLSSIVFLKQGNFRNIKGKSRSIQLSTFMIPSFTSPTLLQKIPFIATDRSIYERFILFDSSIRYLGDHYLFGVGNGNFTKYFYEYAPIGVSGLTMLQPVHNIFLLILVEHGVFFGGLLNLLFLGYMIISAIKTKISLMYILVILTILFIGNVDHYFFTLSQGLMLFFMILGLPHIFRWSSEEL